MGVPETTFGVFKLDRQRQALLREGEPVSIGHRGYLILETLLDADGETVSKTSLLERTWPGLVVEEANLTVQIGALRRALGGDGDALIVTVPRVGYRLVRPPQPVAPMSSSPAAATIAVMPFANLSGSAEQEYFADGMVDELITALSRFKTFAVISRTSSFVFKGRAVDIREAGRQLGVRYLLEGSVRRAGDRLRVTAQLVDAESGAHLWAEKFDGATADVFAFQDAITESVVGLVEPTIRRAEIERARRKPPENLEAYDLFLKAQPLAYGMEVNDYDSAIALLEKAIDLEPNFALAVAFAAWVYEKRLSLASQPGSQTADAARCLALAERAQATDPDDPMVLGICGWLVLHVGRQDAKGLSALRRALAANPNSVVVLNLAGTSNAQSGDLGEARACLTRALKISPAAPDAFQSLTTLAMVEVVDDNPEEAIALCHKALSTFNEWPFTYMTLASAHAYLGRAEQAKAAVERLLTLVPGLTVASLLDGPTNRATGRWPKLVEGLRIAGLPVA